MSELLTGQAAIGHLLRRAGFGAHAATWAEWSELPYDEAVDRVIAELDTPVPPDPAGTDVWELGTIQQLWYERMLAAPSGSAEKLTLFWHGHFATSNTKLINPEIMWMQYALLRGQGAGSFRDLVQGISKDVAMIRWLDGNANRKGHPNENYGRELQELFTLGIGNYTEADIREVSRAFSGWGSRHHTFAFKKQFHDDGEKTFHGKTGRFGGEEAVDILVGLPACSRFMAGKLLRFYSHPDPTEAEVEALAKVFRDADLQVKPTLAALFRSPSFRAKAHYRSLVRSPTEFVIGALRSLGAKEVPGFIHGAVDTMGQILFRPPSVKGWTSGQGWLSSSAIVQRLRTAQRFAKDVAPPDADAALLSVALQDDMPPALRETIADLQPTDRIATVLGGPEFQLC